tara:strand:+ start:961 stop:1296 length:336 start_codon:yes stop_codon:yes gene_type:complete
MVDIHDRMAKVRAAKKPAENKSVHAEVLKLPDDHALSAKNVKEYIAWNKDKLPELKRQVRNKEKGSIAKLADVESYIRNLRGYLRGGQYLDDFYGKEQERKIKWVTIVPRG